MQENNQSEQLSNKEPLIGAQSPKMGTSLNPTSRVSDSNSEYQPPPHLYYRNETQNRLREFISRFKEEKFAKGLQTEDTTVQNVGTYSDSDEDDEVVKKDKDRKWDASILFKSNAPLDAKGCSQIQSLKQYIQGVNHEIKNPRNAFFDLSRHYYNSKYDKDNKKEITVRSYLITEDYQNYVKDLSMDIIQTNQGCMPIIKTFEYNAYNKHKFVKALKFYNYRTDGKLRKQIIVDEGVMHEDFRTYDSSLLHFGNTIIFYKREENWHKLQQYDVVKNQLVELEGYQIEEPIGQEIRYHVMFSKPFGFNRKQQQQKHKNMTVHEFLADQFVICQSYQINDQLQYLNMPIVMFQMRDMSQMISPENEPKILPEAIQYVAHFKEDKTNHIKFLAVDPFATHEFTLDPQLLTYSDYTTYHGNNEMQMINLHHLMDEEKTQQWKHEHLSPFLKHQNPQFLIQKEKVVLNVIDKNKTVDQYYYITNDNQFMLIYPNYLNKEQKNQVIFQIARKHQYNIQADEDYEYLDDFKQRQKDYHDVRYKKISHICNEDYRSKNHMKRADHLRMIMDYPRDLNIHDKLILSTDQEQSNIYIYQSHVVTGENKIEIYNYQNNIAYSSKVKTLPFLIKELQGNEIDTFGAKVSDKKHHQDSDSYHVNATFRNVVASATHVKTPIKDEDDKNMTFALETENAHKYTLVEGKNGAYMNVRIKADHNLENIKLQSYFKTKNYYLFFFTLVNEKEKLERKHTYFAVRKTLQEVNELGQDNHQSILSADQKVTLFLANKLTGKTDKDQNVAYTRDMTFEDLLNFQKEPQEEFMHLTFELVQDNKVALEFVPFIYQLRGDIHSNYLLMFDVEHMHVAHKTCVNSNLAIRSYIKKSAAGFINYTLTRTADLFDQKVGFFVTSDSDQPPLCQLTKFAITAQYNVMQRTDLEEEEEAAQQHQEDLVKRTVELSEYVARFSNCEKCQFNLIGRKQLLLSDSAQSSRQESFERPLFMPFFDKCVKMKGFTVVLREDEQLINLLDQEINNIFHHNSEMLQFGHQKFLTSDNNHEEYVLVISSQLKQRVYMHGNLENNESYYLLNKVQRKLLSMQVAKFEYFVLNDDFDQLMREEFFQAQEVLEGKTICDLCLNFPREVGNGLLQKEQIYSRIDGSLMDEITLGEQDEINFYTQVNLCEKNLVIQVDFNFVSTLRLAMELNSNQSVKLLLRRIFDLNRKSYQEIMMLDFPKMLHAPLIERIYPFLERDHDEYVLTQEDQDKINLRPDQKHEFCNFEDIMTHPFLPPFAQKRVSYHVKESFRDYHNSEAELIKEIVEKDPYMTWNVQNYGDHGHRPGPAKNIEVEHSLVDFQKVIIGEKVRGYQEGIFRNIQFNDQHLASILYIDNEEHIDYYNLETVRKLIDFQFRKTSAFLDLMLKIYVVGFLLPFMISLSTSNSFFLNVSYTVCLFTQIFFVVFEFIQLKEQGLSYFTDFWNIIDTSQFAVFVLLYIIKMISQFQSDSFFEICLLAVLLYQSFYKVFYFIRIYDPMCFIITLAVRCGIEVFPFAIFTVTMMFGFSKLFYILHATASDPETLNFISSDYGKLLVQTYQNSYGGEKAPLKLEDDYLASISGNSLEVTIIWTLVTFFWLCQQAFFGIMGTFFVAQIFQAYEKHYSKMPMYQYKIKASFNVECNQIMDLFMKSSHVKVIFFSIDRKRKRVEDERWLGISNAIRILQVNQNNDNNDKRKEDMKVTKGLSNKQDNANDYLKELLQEQVRLTQCCSHLMTQMGIEKPV